MPQSVNTDSQTHFPVRFIYQLPECVTMARGSADVRLVRIADNLVLVGTASLESDREQSGCDEALFEDPPRTGSHFVTEDFQLPVPEYDDGSVMFGAVPVFVPYFSVSEGQDVVDRLNHGDEPAEVLSGVVNDPEYDRSVTVTFEGKGEPPLEATDFEDSDCHEMIVPVE